MRRKDELEELAWFLEAAYAFIETEEEFPRREGPIRIVVESDKGFVLQVRTPGMGIFPDPATGEMNGIVVGTQAHGPGFSAN